MKLLVLSIDSDK